MAQMAMAPRPTINEGGAPRFFGTSWEEHRLADGLSEFAVFVDNGGCRYEVCVVTMPTAITRAPEGCCIRKGCDMRVIPLEG